MMFKMKYNTLLFIVFSISILFIEQSFAQCGRRRTSRIVNGLTTGVNEFTMMAGLVQGTAFVFCGGTILSNFCVLSSAHCVVGKSAVSLQVLVGDHDYKSSSDTPYAAVYAVYSFLNHPYFNSNTNVNDISIIRTQKSIVFNVAVGPVCLPPTNLLFTNSPAEAVGWGSVGFGSPVSSVLRKVSITIISNAQCNSPSYYKGSITNDQMCTYGGNCDSCQYDSGGPVYVMLNAELPPDFREITLIASVQAQFGGCDYFQNVVPGQTYDIFSPGYGNSYQPGTNCRWRALGPVNSRLTLYCSDISIPQNNCDDRLEISWSGSYTDPSPSYYCGSQTFTFSTSGNQIVLALRSQAGGFAAGKLFCQLTVQSLTTSPGQCDCGRRRISRVVNGEKTGVNEFSMMAGIVDIRDRGVYCGATIISNNHVVTSAHCLTNKIATSLSVLVGDHDNTITTDTPYAIFYPVSKFVTHPSFDRNTNINDIGILTTVSTIEYNVAVGPVCLPFAYEGVSFVDAVVEAVGWGTIFFGCEISTTLRKVSLNIITNGACSIYYGNITGTQMCVKTPTKDTCQRDSRGPLFGTINGRVFLIGIISYGQGCATDYPSVNTRVTSYLNWIKDNTPGAIYCQ